MQIISNNSCYELVEELGVLVNAELKNDFKFLTKDCKVNENQIISFLRKEPGDEEILANLASIHSIAINLTDECCFRCSYCIYSGDYEYERTHGNRTIDYKTAVKAIDFFLELIDNNLRYRKDNTFSVGFYGGEPLLCFEQIRQIITATEELLIEKKLIDKFKIDFRLNTNGYLLTDEIADFLREKNVIVDISLDGPESEHNKLRRARDGGKTWDTVMANIESLFARYPEYCKEKVNYLCTMHPLHDLIELEEFFNSRPQLFNIDRIRFNAVDFKNLKPPARKEMEKILAGKEPERMGDIISGRIASENFEGKFKLKNVGHCRKFTGTCFPGGTKVFIDCDGGFHICEKINSNFTIGNVDFGFDFEKIRAIVKAYNEEIIKNKCWECEWWSLCAMCLALAAKNKVFKFECEKKKVYQYGLLKNHLKQLEANDDETNSNNIGITDYIEQL